MAERTLKVTILGDDDQVRKAFQRTAKAAGDVERPLQSVGTRAKNAFGAMSSSASMAFGSLFPVSGVLDGVSGAMQQTEGSGRKVGPVLTGIGVAATGAGVLLTKMGDESKQATAQLRTAIENTGDSMDLYEGRINRVSSRLIKLGFDDEATARSLASLTTATQDTGKALDLMGLAADIAAARHISLESATDKLVKMQAGNTRIFKEFGIQIDSNASSTEKAAAMTELQARVQGQAAAQADTFSGRMKALAIEAENVAEAVGEKIGPALTVVGPLIAGVGGIIQSGLVPSLAQAKAGFMTAIGPLGIAGLTLGLGALIVQASGATEAVKRLASASDRELVSAFESAVRKSEGLRAVEDTFGSIMDSIRGKTSEATKTFRELAEQSPATAQRLIDAMRASGDETGKFEKILGEVAGRHKQAATDAQSNAGATQVVADKAKLASDAIGQLSAKLNELIGVHVSESQALTTFHSNLDTLRQKLAENGVSLDVTSEKGRQNRGAIDSMVSGIGSHMEALAREGATMDTMRSTFNRHIDDFTRTMRQAGFTERQIESLKQEYGLVPSKVETALRVLGESEYVQAMERARARANTLRDVGVAIKGIAFASGGLLPGGGTTDGPVAIVGEGRRQHHEYVIPTDPQYRKRATGLFMSLGDELDLLQAGGVLGRPGLRHEIQTDIAPLGRFIGQRIEGLVDRYGAIGSGQVGSGWRAITNWLSSVGEPYTITSTTGGKHAPGSYHYRGKAVDLVSGNMMHLARRLLNIAGSLSELFYTPLGYSIKNGRKAGFTVAGHYNHVHAATFDQGGAWPSGTLGLNTSGGTETVLPPGMAPVTNYYFNNTFVLPDGTTRDQAEAVAKELERMSRRGQTFAIKVA